jgi:hypothetical protein
MRNEIERPHQRSDGLMVAINAATFVAEIGRSESSLGSLDAWALGAYWRVTLFPDGTVNALDPTGRAIYDLTAGNEAATAAALATYRRLSAAER